MKTTLDYIWLSIFLLLTLSIAACKQRSPEQLDKLITELQSSDPKKRNAAALEISSYGEDGQRAVGPLIRLLNTDPNRGIKTSAAYALRSIGTKEAKGALDSFEK